MSRVKRNRKNVKSNEKSKSKPSPTCKGSKNQNTTKNQRNHSEDDNDITVKRLTMICRKYQEFHDNYLTYDKILIFLQKTKRSNPNSMDLIEIGKSTQGKPIYMVIISSGFYHSSDCPKMAAFIEAGLNGENAIAVSNTLYMIEYLTQNPNFVRKIMEYHIVPCCNPDAYDAFIKSKENNKNNSNLDKNKNQTKNNKSDREHKKESHNQKNDKNHRGDSKNETRAKEPNSNNNTSSKHTSGEENSSGFTEDSNNSLSDNPNSDSEDSNNNKEDSTKSPHQLGISTQGTNQSSVRVDLSKNFPVVLGLNNMGVTPTDSLFLEKIKQWKENFVNQSPETRAVLRAIYTNESVIKLLISLQEDGEAVCYPYGCCPGTFQEINDLKDVAKKAKGTITGRNFEYGSLYDIQGLTYGNLVDFLKVEKSTIKYMYVIKVHKKTASYNEKSEQKQLMRYGGEIMECVKRMSCCVYKFFTDINAKIIVETQSTKSCIDKWSKF